MLINHYSIKNDGSTTGPTILWDEMKDKKVKSIDGENQGKIEKISQNHIMVEEGLIKKKRFWIPKFIADVYDGKFVWLDITHEEINKDTIMIRNQHHLNMI